MGLKFDSDSLIKKIQSELIKELNNVLPKWQEEVKRYMRSNFCKTNAKTDFYVKQELKREANIIAAYLQANTYVIADSFGTGSLMLADNSDYQEYRDNIGDKEGQWNPLRKSNAIVGRKKGTYYDIFGRKRGTSGKLAGINIEGWEITKKGKKLFTIEPIPPSKALQIAEEWLYTSYLKGIFGRIIENIDFSEYIIEDRGN